MLQEAVPATQASRPDWSQPSSDALVSYLISLADTILPWTNLMVLNWWGLPGPACWTCWPTWRPAPCPVGWEARLRPCWSWVDSRAIQKYKSSLNVSLKGLMMIPLMIIFICSWNNKLVTIWTILLFLTCKPAGYNILFLTRLSPVHYVVLSFSDGWVSLMILICIIFDYYFKYISTIYWQT